MLVGREAIAAPAKTSAVQSGAAAVHPHTSPGNHHAAELAAARFCFALPWQGPSSTAALEDLLPGQAADQVGEQLRAAGWLPEVVICSNAQRTRQTLDVLQKAVPEIGEADQHFLGSLYTTAALDGQTRSHLSELVAAEAAPSHSCCLCLGHNKGWEEAASSFAGETVRLGNAHAALLEAQGASWAEALAEGTRWRLVQVLTPQAA